MAKSTVCGPEMKRHTGRALSLQWPSSRALQPDTMRALPQGGNRRRLAHGARRLVAGKSATSATRARRETQWERAKGQTLVLFITSMPASPARPPGAALGARALATRLYPTFSSTATRIARRGATRNALSPPQTANSTYHSVNFCMSSRCENRDWYLPSIY